MSQELYTFACPSCAVKLSVPKTLAGVRGPCPQCHAEITAPPVEEAAPPPAQPPAVEKQKSILPPPRKETAPAPVPPELPAGLPPLSAHAEPPQPPFPPTMEEVTDDVWQRPLPSGPPQETAAEEAGGSYEPPQPPVRAQRRGGSKAALIGGVLALLALGALAALNFLPENTLKEWAAQWKERGAGKAEAPAAASPSPIPSPAPAPATASIEESPALAAEPEPEPAPSEIAEAAAPTPPAEETAAVATAATEAPAEPEASPAFPTVKPAEEPAPEIAKAEPAETAAPAVPQPASAGPPSLLPDISAPAAEAAEAGSETADPLTAPRKTLTDFLKAKTWRERLPLSLGGESLRSEMQQFYKASKDGANAPTSLEYVSDSPVPGSDFTVHVFHATFADLPQGCPISVEETAQGWKVDWRAFVEFREGRLKKFFEKYQNTPATFRVILRRTHFFDKDVPNLDNKYCFHVSAPVFGHEGYVFVDKDNSIVAPKIAEKLDWKGVHYDMVSLKWVKGSNNHSYVELRDLTNGWRQPPPPASRAQ